MRRATEREAANVAAPAEFSVQAYFQTLGRILPQLPYAEIQQIIAVFLRAFDEGRTIFIFGNGGSARKIVNVLESLWGAAK